MRIRQRFLILIILTAALNTPPTTHGQNREDELRSDIAAAFEIVTKAERGGVDVETLVEDLNAALRIIEDGRATNLDLAETKIDAIIASAPTLAGKIASIAMFRWLKTVFTITLLSATAIIAKRYGPKAFWTLWLKAMRDWTVHP
ncbi:MAG: hypothetical protein NWE88_02995 [Candidatus Bathyarchaeota archaeon]|nr:hypothetical protein [Candidatus Bathyarchaeota archaeon]